MKVPAVEGIIERRLLVNYRVDPGALTGILPPPFRPKLAAGYAMAGICLIRLARVRPRGLPGAVGLRSENAAHRIAVEWDADGRTHEGVYIPRRDSDSRFNNFVGGRVFPGEHQRAVFTVSESDDYFDVALHSDDGRTRVADWRVEPLAVERVASSFFEDTGQFPLGSTAFDCALVMRGVRHSWHALPTLSHSTFD